MRSHLLGVAVILALGSCSGGRAENRAPPEHAGGETVGVWQEKDGAFVEIVGGEKELTLALWKRRPTSLDAVPWCVAYDVSRSAPAFPCHVGLRSCVVDVAVGRDGDTLTVRSEGAARGADCRGELVSFPLELRRGDLLDTAAELYLADARGFSGWKIGDASIEAVASLGADPAGVARGIAELLDRELSARWARRSSLVTLVDLVRVAHYRLLDQCGGLPGTEACPIARARQIILDIVGPPPSEKDSAPGEQRAESVASGATPPRAGRGLLGTWAGRYAELGASTGFVELAGSDGEMDVTFSESVPLDLDHLADCKASGGPGTLRGLVCRECARRIGLREEGDELLVELLGDGWIDDRCSDRAAIRNRRLYYRLRRADPFSLMVNPYVESARNSDLGSSGGNLFFTVLGEQPARVVRELGARTRRAYIARGRDPWTLTLEQAGQLVQAAQMLVLQACDGVMPAAQYERAAAPCQESTIEAAITSAVGAFIDEGPAAP